jgi:hypothetical protein
LLSICLQPLAQYSQDFVLFEDQVLLAVDLDLGAGPLSRSARVSPAFTVKGPLLPFSSTAAEPTATTSACCGFSFALSGMMIPPTSSRLLLSRCTRILSRSGLTFSFAI